MEKENSQKILLNEKINRNQTIAFVYVSEHCSSFGSKNPIWSLPYIYGKSGTIRPLVILTPYERPSRILCYISPHKTTIKSYGQYTHGIYTKINPESTIDSEGFKGGTRGAPIMPRDAVSRTANVERTGQHKWVINHKCRTHKGSVCNVCLLDRSKVDALHRSTSKY